MKNNNYLLSMNYGQHVLYGFLSTSIQAQRGSELTFDELSGVVSLVKDLTSFEHYQESLDTPDVEIMIRPQDSFKIFCEWYDENVTYFQDYLAVSE